MGTLTPVQRRRRDRLEAVIRLAEPGLNLVLAVGERMSQLVQRHDDDYYPPQRGTLPPSRRAPGQGSGEPS